MKQTNSILRLISLFFLSLVFTVLASCGSDGSSSTSTTGITGAGTGSVALLLTDAPSDIFEEINITVIKAELLSDDGKVTLFEGERTFDLLDLTDARIFAIREGIPAGTYNKIRLTLTDIELVDYNGADTPADYQKFYPKLPADGKLDLNPRGSFDVVAGGTLAIQIDMDAGKSIHIVTTGKKDTYIFRPVVFITILTDGFTERYVKMHGDVTGIVSADYSFQLCNTGIPVKMDDALDDSRSGCVKVSADATTSVFDINGKPASLTDLVEGEPATVFGRLKRDASDDSDSDHDEDYDEEDGDDYEGKDDDDDRDHKVAKKMKSSKHGDSDDDRKMDDMVLVAALIELGPESGFQKLRGSATSAVSDTDQFDMDVAPGQGLTTPLILKVQIQEGTILINRKGVPVDPADIDTGKLLNVRGVLDVAEDTLFASLIMVDTDSSSKLSGKVGDNPDGSCGFALMTDIGDRSVATNTASKAFMVTADSSTPIDIADLAAGQQVDAYGKEGSDGCFAAHTIIAF